MMWGRTLTSPNVLSMEKPSKQFWKAFPNVPNAINPFYSVTQKLGYIGSQMFFLYYIFNHLTELKIVALFKELTIYNKKFLFYFFDIF